MRAFYKLDNEFVTMNASSNEAMIDSFNYNFYADAFWWNVLSLLGVFDWFEIFFILLIQNNILTE